MEREFMTSAQVAEVLGVGPTSIKRWADSGLLPCVRTPGGHRRFLRNEVDRFLQREADGWASAASDVNAWVDRLTTGASAFEVQSALFAERSRLGSWWKVADSVSEVMREIGRRWAGGGLEILDEHLATESLERALARCSESIAVAGSAPTCLLAAAEGEEHTLGLTMAELVLRAAGWQGRWGGRVTPHTEILRLMEARAVDLVAVAALAEPGEPTALAAEAVVLADAARRTGVAVALCGNGEWPTSASEVGSGVFRVRTFEQFDKLLVELHSHALGAPAS